MSDNDKAFELQGMCDRCRKTDGRATSAFTFTNKDDRATELCDECAELTKAEHEIEPARAKRNKPAGDRQGDGETKGATEKGTSAALGGGETQVPRKP